MDPTIRGQYTRIKLSHERTRGPCDLEAMYRLDNADSLVDKDTFNPVVSIEKRIIRALLPDGFHERIRASKNSLLHKVWGRWSALLDHWRMRGRNTVEADLDDALIMDMPCVAVKIRLLLDPEHELLCISEDRCHLGAAASGVPCPAFLLGTTVVFRDYGTVRITFMQFMDGFVPLGGTIIALCPGARARLESVLVHMWESGIAHCDLHEGNVLIPGTERGADPSRFCIVDFGYSLMLRRGEVLAFRAAMDAGDCPADAFDATLTGTLIKVQSMRRLPFFHCDSMFLRMLHQIGIHQRAGHVDTDKKLEGVNRVGEGGPRKRATARNP